MDIFIWRPFKGWITIINMSSSLTWFIMRFVTCSAKENKVHEGGETNQKCSKCHYVSFLSCQEKKNIKYNKIFLENGASWKCLFFWGFFQKFFFFKNRGGHVGGGSLKTEQCREGEGWRQEIVRGSCICRNKWLNVSAHCRVSPLSCAHIYLTYYQHRTVLPGSRWGDQQMVACTVYCHFKGRLLF